MHASMFVVLDGCYFSTAFYPDAERVIWMRSRNSELAYSVPYSVSAFRVLFLPSLL